MNDPVEDLRRMIFDLYSVDRSIAREFIAWYKKYVNEVYSSYSIDPNFLQSDVPDSLIKNVLTKNIAQQISDKLEMKVTSDQLFCTTYNLSVPLIIDLEGKPITKIKIEAIDGTI